MKTRFDDELEALKCSVIMLGSMAEEGLKVLIEALKSHDEESLGILAENSRWIAEKERSIESDCLRLLLRRQPVARDLRTISSALRIVSDIDRIGDNSADIAEIIPFLKEDGSAERIGLDSMAGDVKRILNQAIDSFVHMDSVQAESAIGMDDVIDSAFVEAKNRITLMIREGEDDAEEAPDLLMIAKYLERMADHAVSIAQWVIWSLDGQANRTEN